MTAPTPLSPAAQAVMDALPSAPHLQMVNRAYAAAALRAAADEISPDPWSLKSCCDERERAVRSLLLAIAAELEGAQ